MAALRGTVNISYSKTRKSTKQNTNGSQNDNEKHDSEFIQTEQLDYEIEPSVTEDAARAVIQLRNLALGNAISQGRNYLTTEDAKFIIRVCFSTTKIYRANMLNLLLENNGELTTSQITTGLDISKPHALQTMQEFDALKICTISTISSYEKSEKKIKLTDEFSWFLTKEFKQIYKPVMELITPDLGNRESICCDVNCQHMKKIIENLSSSNDYYLSNVCDNKNADTCHTNKVNYNHKEDKKNNLLQTKDNIDEITIKDVESFSNANILSNNKTEIDNNDEYLDRSKEDNNLSSIDNNYSLRVEKQFTRVTPSQEKCHTVHNKTKQIVPNDVIGDIIQVVKDENGHIAANLAIELAIQTSQVVKEFLKDEKLTARDSRKVRNIFVEINRHSNIKVVKRKPQLIVIWIEQEKEKEEVLVNN